MLPKNKKETAAALIILALAIAWVLTVCLYGPALFRAIDSVLPR